MSDRNEDSLGGRLKLLSPDEYDADQKDLRRRLDADLLAWTRKSGFKGETSEGRPIGPFNGMLLSPRLGQGMLDYLTAERKETSLSPRVREVIILTVGAIWRSAYELYSHTQVARKAGLAPEVVDALAAGRPAEGLTEEEQAAHEFTRALVAEHHVQQSLYDRAVARLGERGLTDLIHLAGLYMSTCALLNAFEVPVPK